MYFNGIRPDRVHIVNYIINFCSGLAKSIYESFCEAENEISNVVNYNKNIRGINSCFFDEKKVSYVKSKAGTARCIHNRATAKYSMQVVA